MKCSIVFISTLMTLVLGCSEEKSDYDNKTDTLMSQDQMKAAGFNGHLSASEVPLEILTIPARSKSYLNLPSFDGEIGVLVSEGYKLIKRYPEPVLKISNVKFNKENFATSYSAFNRFSANEKNEFSLLFENKSNENLIILVYKIPTSVN